MSENHGYRYNVNKLMLEFPYYVNEYIQSKDTIPLSIASIYSYCLEFRKFLKWMNENNITNHANIKEITLKEMENVTKRELEAFVLHERLRLESKCGSNIHTSALNRTIAAIKSLYNYLCEQTEDSNGNTYMIRNVSRLIHIRKKCETLHYRAAQLEGKLFLGDETKAFLEYVENDYEKSISNRAKTSFKKNKVRDLAILSLFLSSGLRCAELVGINLNDLNLETGKVSVMRKEGKKDVVPIAHFSHKYIKDYFEARSSMKTEVQALFVTDYNQQIRKISNASINKLVAKYSEAYKVRVTPHTLRHTFAMSVIHKSLSAINWGIPQLSLLSYIPTLSVLKLKML
ncbi:tyrosine recombinase XerS [Lactococcus lactis]|uniref:tyrosine recombinase XerS n=1 Tax=Lactococcus lactis TaxID=1358 RepID=UPI001F0F137B|nr:tyrosine recombinase XerS [Lactococcus lactis]MCH5427125.1 tyrosine recombinase XerS [Lactococcus lactis]